jgi:hypothetical protein
MVQGFARIAGVVLLLVGIAGFFLPTTGTITKWIQLSSSQNIVYLLTGIIFLAVSSSFLASKIISITVGLVYAFAVIFGLFDPTLFGLITVTPTIEIAHFVVAILALVIGIQASRPEVAKQTESA